MDIRTCNKCGVKFNPSAEGVVGGKVSYCGTCCNRYDCDETAEDTVIDMTGKIQPPTCNACEREVMHVNALSHFCDDCEDQSHAEQFSMADTQHCCPYCSDDTCGGWCK